MLTSTELKILQVLFDDFTRQYTIREISLRLHLPYPQVHRTVGLLHTKKLVLKKEIGKSQMLSLNWERVAEEYILTELERKKAVVHKYPRLKILGYDLERLPLTQYICLLFGSYAEGKAKPGSDIDLLFVIPETYNYTQFEGMVRGVLTSSLVDVQITTEQGLREMWNTPGKFNVGNELLRKHVVLYGAEAFLQLRRKWHNG